MNVSARFAHGGENVIFLTQIRTKCVLTYQKSTYYGPNVYFADLLGSTALSGRVIVRHQTLINTPTR